MITFASKALSPVEQHYSQTERKTLVWACEHFHLYIFGAPVTLVNWPLPHTRYIRKTLIQDISPTQGVVSMLRTIQHPATQDQCPCHWLLCNQNCRGLYTAYNGRGETDSNKSKRSHCTVKVWRNTKYRAMDTDIWKMANDKHWPWCQPLL